MDDLNTSSLSVMSYLKIFFRRKWLFIIPVYAGLIFGVCAGIVLPKKYLSSTIILVEEGKSDNPLFNNLAVSTTVTQRMTAIQESMLGWNSLVKLVKRLNMDSLVKTPQDLEKLILGIRKDIIIKLRDKNIIDLSYIGTEPEQTQAVVKNITEIFIERNVEVQSKETSDAITFIEGQLHLYQGKIKSAEIAQLQDQLNTLLLDSTEQHPHVKQLREQIENKKQELAKENLVYTENVSLDTSTTNPIIDEIKKALGNIETASNDGPDANGINDPGTKDIYKVMLIDKLDNVIARDVNVNTNIYNMLLQRLETAKITQRLQSSKEGTKYTILDPPRVPLDPVQPNKVLVIMMGTLLGAIIGGALVFAIEFLDKSFLDVEEAKEYLGTPLLGAISKIVTVESLQQDKVKQGWIAGLTAVAGVIIVIVTVLVSKFISNS